MVSYGTHEGKEKLKRDPETRHKEPTCLFYATKIALRETFNFVNSEATQFVFSGSGAQ